MDSIRFFPKFSIVFLIVMIFEIIGLTIAPSFHMVTKPMILASLIGFYISTEKKQNNAFLMGMILALLADCFVMNYTSFDFIGLALYCSLFMHLLYASEFNQKRRIGISRVLIFPLSIAISCISFIVLYWSKFENLKISIALYGISMVTMIILAYFRHPKLRGYKEVIFGAILFSTAMYLLIYHIFGNPIQYASIIIMVLYMISQYLIVTGVVLGKTPLKSNPPKVKNTTFARHKA